MRIFKIKILLKKLIIIIKIYKINNKINNKIYKNKKYLEKYYSKYYYINHKLIILK